MSQDGAPRDSSRGIHGTNQAGREPAGVFGFWVLLAGAGALGMVLGQRLGGRALDDGLPWLVEVASNEPVDEDW